jgi:hypothetical protein
MIIWDSEPTESELPAPKWPTPGQGNTSIGVMRDDAALQAVEELRVAETASNRSPANIARHDGRSAPAKWRYPTLR